jgi:hypothetical protein
MATSSAPGPTDTVDLSRLEALAEPHAAPSAAVPARVPPRRAARRQFTWAYAGAALIVVAAIGVYAVLQGSETQAAIQMPAAPPSPQRPALESLPAKAVDVPEVQSAVARNEPVPAARVEPRKPVEPRKQNVVAPATEETAVEERTAATPPPPPAHAPTTPPVLAHDPALTFDTRVLVGTKKPKEHGARLMVGEGRILVVASDDPTSVLYAIPYNRVMSISYSHGRDPLWNSPQGPTAIARGGGTLARLGIVVERNWISLRTSTEDQFVAMRFEKVLEQRVLLALEERTGRKPELVEDAKD